MKGKDKLMNDKSNQNNENNQDLENDTPVKDVIEPDVNLEENQSDRVIDENRPVRRKKPPQLEDDVETFNEDEEDDQEQEDQDVSHERQHREPRNWKRREHRLWVRIIRKIAVALVIIGVLAYIFVFGFRLRTVNITGNYAYSDEEVLSFFDYEQSPKNTLLFWWNNRHGLDESVSFIENISVSIASPGAINIRVTEKMLVGCLDDRGVYMFFDSSGTIVESSTARPEDVPLIIGMDGEGLQLGDTLQLEDTNILNILHELSVYLKNYEISIDQIDCTDKQSLVMYKGSIKILLGSGTNLEEKINAYNDLELSLEGLSGQLHLEEYDSTKNSIFFSQD